MAAQVKESKLQADAGHPRWRHRAPLAAAGLLALGLPGCQSIAVNAGNVAMLRVVDVSPDAPNLDVYENGSAIAYNIGFSTNSSYIAFAPGNYVISTEQTKTRTQITTASGSLANVHDYTVLVSNVNASLQETILPDQNIPPPGNQIAVRFLDEVTKIGSGVDVYLVSSSGKLNGSTPVATNLTFGANSGYLNLPAGTYALAVVPTGSAPGSSSGTLYMGSQINYAPGAVRTVVLIDQQIVTSPGLQALVLSDFDPNASGS